jgi:hypothetical protein
MRVFFMIRIKVDLKRDIYLHVKILLFLVSLLSKHLLLLPQIIQKIIDIHEASRECIWLR